MDTKKNCTSIAWKYMVNFTFDHMPSLLVSLRMNRFHIKYLFCLTPHSWVMPSDIMVNYIGSNGNLKSRDQYWVWDLLGSRWTVQSQRLHSFSYLIHPAGVLPPSCHAVNVYQPHANLHMRLKSTWPFCSSVGFPCRVVCVHDVTWVLFMSTHVLGGTKS